MQYANQNIIFSTEFDEYELVKSNHQELLKKTYSELEKIQNKLERREIDLVKEKKSRTQIYLSYKELLKELQDTKCALNQKEEQYIHIQAQTRGDENGFNN